jgi:putative DNA primase/helicase
MNKEFNALCGLCPQLKKLLEEQKMNRLPKDKWLSVMRLLVDAGRIALAREFSAQSKEKHNYESEAYIDNLSVQRKGNPVGCVELGCTKEKSKPRDRDENNSDDGCFGGKLCITNGTGKTINSPAPYMQFTKKEKRAIGFFFKEEEKEEEEDKGQYGGMNPNIYARHILKNYSILFHEAARYFMYRGNCWKSVSDFALQKTLRFFFDKIEPDAWRTAIQNRYFGTLCYECWGMEDMRTAENFINVKNGLLNLSTEEVTLEPHNKKIFCTNQIPIIYDKDAKCDKFKDFLHATFGGKTKGKVNKKLIALVQEIMGYCLSSSVKAHKMFLFFGEGYNGKSVLTDIMTALAGGEENVSNVSIEDFNKKFSLAQIAGKTLNISTENKLDSKTNTQILKAIVAGDPVQMEEKFQAAYSYRPFVKLVFSMNEKPFFTDKSHGLYRRLQFIPFDVLVEEDKRDPDLATNLIREELAGILVFAIQGLKRLRDNNYKFTFSKKANKLLEEVKETSDGYLQFVRDRIIVIADEGGAPRLSKKEVRDNFSQWCNDEGHTKLKNISNKKFWAELRRVFKAENIPFTENAEDAKRYLDGIRLRGDDEEEEEQEAAAIQKKDDSLDEFLNEA